MKDKQNFRQVLLSFLPIMAGNFLYALTVKLFLLPGGLVVGGTNGIALIIQHIVDIPISVFVFIFNMIMLAIGFLVLGKQFAITTIASSFLYPLMLGFLDWLLGDFILTDDVILCTIFSGLGIGLALGLVIRNGASTGGMDIPPLILQKLFRIPVSVSMYAFDVCIILAQAFFRPKENILFGVLLLLIYTTVLDRVMMLGATRTEVKIISKHSNAIREAILKQIDRGVTMLNGEGGYLREETQIVLSVISNRELARMEKLIHEIDPESFMIITRVTEVSGRGFSMKKKYQ